MSCNGEASVVCLSVCLSVCKLLRKSLLLPGKWQDRDQTCTRWSPGKPASRVCSRSIKGHLIRALSWILGMRYSVIDGLVLIGTVANANFKNSYWNNCISSGTTIVVLPVRKMHKNELNYSSWVWWISYSRALFFSTLYAPKMGSKSNSFQH